MESLTLVEAYVDRLDTAVAAATNGAGRLELCGPGEGGLTPTPELMAAVLAAVTVPVHAMLRPRTGDFVYTASEFAQMRDEVAMIRDAGAAGVVLGISHPDGTLDVERMGTLIALARPVRIGIHRAFDATPDPAVALEQCIALGIDVILAAGHAPTAEEGISCLARLQAQAAGRTIVMPGGGVRAHNVGRILRQTGVHEVHARASDPEVFAALVRAVRTA